MAGRPCIGRLRSNESPAIIAALLDAGADLKARDKVGRTPLHSAAWSNESPAIIAALLDAGADLKARDRGWLDAPAFGGYGSTSSPAIIAALLDAGADPKARDRLGETPWDYAKDQKVAQGSPMPTGG